MEIKFGSTSRFAEYIQVPLKDSLLFDAPVVTETETCKITSVLNKFLKGIDPKIDGLDFSEDVKENLKDIHDFYKIDQCELHGIKEEEFPQFCKLVDECIINKIQDLNNRTIYKNEDIENKQDVEENNKIVKKTPLELKLEEAKQRLVDNDIKQQTFSPTLRKRTMDQVLGSTPQEEEARGYIPDWLDAYADILTSEEEVEFILLHWKSVSLITNFIGRFSFPELIRLQRPYREFLLVNVKNVISLFECDKGLTCAQLMELEEDDRELLLKNVENVICLFECDPTLTCLQLIKVEKNVRELFLNKALEISVLFEKIDRYTFGQNAIISIHELLSCSHHRLELILNSPYFCAILLFYEIPFEHLLDLGDITLALLLKDIYTKDSREFLDMYTSPHAIIQLSDKKFESLSNKNQEIINSNFIELREALLIFQIKPLDLFAEDNKELLDLSLSHIHKIKKLLYFNDLIPENNALIFIQTAVDLVNRFKPEEIQIIEDFPASIRQYILQDFQRFCELLNDNDVDLSGPNVHILINDLLGDDVIEYDINEKLDGNEELDHIDEDEEFYLEELEEQMRIEERNNMDESSDLNN